MKSEPDERGMFGPYGGRFVPEMLISALDELVEESAKILADPRSCARLGFAGELVRVGLRLEFRDQVLARGLGFAWKSRVVAEHIPCPAQRRHAPRAFQGNTVAPR